MKLARRCVLLLLCALLALMPVEASLAEAMGTSVEGENEDAALPVGGTETQGGDASELPPLPGADDDTALPVPAGGMDGEAGDAASAFPGEEGTDPDAASDRRTEAVDALAPALLLPQAEFSLGVGESGELGAGFSDGRLHGIRYSSSDPQIVTVDEQGFLRAMGEGEAEVQLQSEFGEERSVHVAVYKAPSQLFLSAPRGELGVNEQLQLQAALPEGSYSRLQYSVPSEQASVATVSDEGLVTSFRPGSFTVLVRSFNGKEASVTLQVRPAPTGISLDCSEMALDLGESAQLTATLEPEDSAGARHFRAEPEGIVELDPSTGKVTAVAPGRAVITVESYNHRSASCIVQVRPVREGWGFDEEAITIGVGERVAAPVHPGEDSALSLRYVTSNEKVVTVSQSGILRGVQPGKATITATSTDGSAAMLRVTVRAAPARVTLRAAHTVLGVGESVQLTAKLPSGSASRQLTYGSSDEAVLSVEESGIVTALAEGVARITVQSYNGRKDALKFTVSPAPAGVTLPEALTLGKGEKLTLTAGFLPGGSDGGRTFTVDDPAIARIDAESGALEALGPGSTTVRVRSYNGCEAACALTVKNAPDGIVLQDKNFKLSVGDTRQLLPPVLEGEDAASGKLIYKSANPKVAKVNSAGLVTALKPGKAKITVRTFNKKHAGITVTVRKAPKSISFEEEEHRLLLHDSFVPAVSFSNRAAGNYTLASSDPSVASVDGIAVYGMQPGRVTLTATSYNGKQATMQVHVPFPPERIWFESEELVLGEGDSNELLVRAPEGQGALLEYSVDDAGIVEIEKLDNETVLVRAAERGETTLRAHSDNGLEATAKLRVLQAPTALRLFPDHAQYSLDEGQMQLQWAYASEGEGGSVSFTSSDEEIAGVSEGGLVRFLRTGTVHIRAYSYNGHAAECVLEIGEKPGQMVFSQEEYCVALGDSVRLDAAFDVGCESYVLQAQDEGIVTASGDRVQGKAVGSTRVTAVSRSGLEASCSVRVVDAPTGISFAQTEVELVFGLRSSLQLTASCSPDGVGSVFYSTSDPTVAIVDSATGVVTAQEKGECVVLARSYDGKYSAQCAVRVSYLLEGVRIGIDPGHQARGNMERESISPKGGGSKPKCAYSSAGVAHVSEHVIDLQIARRLRKALEALGAEVYMTRETANVDISNQQRAKMMNKLGVDFVLRIHANSWVSSSAQGFSIIRRRSCAYSPKEVNGTKVMNAEKKLGESIARYFHKRTGARWRGLGMSDDYTMNNWSKVPCLLLEVGFMTHPVEGRNIVKPKYQKKIVKGIVEGICKYEGVPLPKEWWDGSTK